MKYRSLQMAVFLLAAALVLSACSGGGGGGESQAAPKVQLSGTVSGSYGYKPGLGKSFFAPGTGKPNKIVAIPMDRGALQAWNMSSSVSGTISGNGSFDISVDTTRDWLFVLVESPNYFIGSLAVSAGTTSILNVPITTSTVRSISLGTVSAPGGGDAVSGSVVNASSFGMTNTQINTLASSNDIFKNAKNIINNYDPATGKWYQLRPDFEWSGSYAAIGTAFSGPTWTYLNYHFQMDTNATNLTIQNLCTNGTATFVTAGWRPPVTVTTVGGFKTYDNANPLTNSAATCTTYLSDGVLATKATGGSFFATDAYWNLPYGTISYGTQEWFSGAIPSGNWTWEEGGSVIATFDPSVGTPVHSDGARSLGYVPSIKLTTSGTGTALTITAVDVEWYYFDTTGASYVKVTSAADLAVMRRLIDMAEVIIEKGSGSSHSSYGFDPAASASYHLALPTAGDPTVWTYAADQTCGARRTTDAGAIGVFYSSGGIGRYYFARATFCP